MATSKEFKVSHEQLVKAFGESKANLIELLISLGDNEGFGKELTFYTSYKRLREKLNNENEDWSMLIGHMNDLKVLGILSEGYTRKGHNTPYTLNRKCLSKYISENQA